MSLPSEAEKEGQGFVCCTPMVTFNLPSHNVCATSAGLANKVRTECQF